MTDRKTWRQSSYSANQNACVELHVATERTAMRDSKDPNGGMLAIGRASWTAFVEGVTSHVR